jgi:hypothetical protein
MMTFDHGVRYCRVSFGTRRPKIVHGQQLGVVLLLLDTNAPCMGDYECPLYLY